MTLPEVDTKYLLDTTVNLLNIPSPTGYTQQVIDFIEAELEAFIDSGFSCRHTHKGALVVTWPGKLSDSPRALTAHADTLGAMVKEIKPNGRLKLSNLGSVTWNTVEGEGCTVIKQTGEEIRGSLLLTKASGHVYGRQLMNLKREADNMEVRLDARTNSTDETLALGIRVGDFVAFDPRVEVSNGFIRSRYLDDKSGVASLLATVKAMHENDLRPTQTTTLHFSNYEEVGHGAAAGLPSDLVELVAVDMAAVGEGQTSDEFHATLCVKDSGGPYHHGLSQQLRELAEKNDIAYKVDIYPYYGSDGEAYWRSGGDVAVALIGPGVDASHNYERTHIDALVATTQWVLAYLLSDS
ncbi:MAG: M42 family metallopeptidase [Anaerolineales bacterium]|jgi:putative aminopeptidase FrvX